MNPSAARYIPVVVFPKLVLSPNVEGSREMIDFLPFLIK
jgi:hypothetical protein